MSEQWRDNADYEGLYRVSSYGRVFSLRRRKMLMGGGNEYCHVFLHKDDTKKYISIHVLVLEAFVGPRAEGMVACHNDGNCFNNKASNLRWDTRSNNNKDKAGHGTVAVGEKHSQSKLTDNEVRDVKARLRNGEMHKDIAERYGVSRGAITQINLGNNWGHIS